jgi:hypothetical protein
MRDYRDNRGGYRDNRGFATEEAVPSLPADCVAVCADGWRDRNRWHFWHEMFKRFKDFCTAVGLRKAA